MQTLKKGQKVWLNSGSPELIVLYNLGQFCKVKWTIDSITRSAIFMRSMLTTEQAEVKNEN